MKTSLHFVPAFFCGLSSAVVLPIFCFNAYAQAPVPMASGAPGAGYGLGAVTGSWGLPGGYSYSAIEAWVRPGETHGAPYVLGTPVGAIREAGLFVAHESPGGMEFGEYMPAKSLFDEEMGFDSGATVVANDLKRMPDGSPLIIGASRSPRTASNGSESTIWEISSSGQSLNPITRGFLATSTDSILIGGNSVDGYAGGTTVFPGYIPPTGGGQTLPVPPPGRGFASDLDGGTIVGEADFRGFFFNKNQEGDWVLGTLELPNWSDGTGGVSDVVGDIMGGYLYNPELDDVVPVLWNTDGSLYRVFDLPGYNVTELILDQGSVVALLNQGEGVNVFGESRLYAEGWAQSRLIYGDILPALSDGGSATVRDISAGGSLWMLSQFVDATGTSYGIASVATSTQVPEPSAFMSMTAILLATVCRGFYSRK